MRTIHRLQKEKKSNLAADMTSSSAKTAKCSMLNCQLMLILLTQSFPLLKQVHFRLETLKMAIEFFNFTSSTKQAI